MKIALLLSTAFVTTKPGFPDRERRIQQYESGFRQVAELSAKHPSFDVFSVDNTVEDPTQLEPRLLAGLGEIPGLKATYYFWDNELGRLNKGSGVVVQWNRILPDLIGRYEYIVHYEPRQHLVNFSFFERMESKPDTYICPYRDKVKFYGVPIILRRFWTGLFSMRTSDLLAYARAPDRGVFTTTDEYGKRRSFRHLRRRLLPRWLTVTDGAIESGLPRYVRRHKIPFARISALGTRWNDETNEKWIDMVECVFDTKRCAVCRDLIDEIAVKCVICGAVQPK